MKNSARYAINKLCNQIGVVTGRGAIDRTAGWRRLADGASSPLNVKCESVDQRGTTRTVVSAAPGLLIESMIEAAQRRYLSR